MSIITTEALKLAQQKDLFFDLLDQKLPPGYSIKVPEFNYIPESTHIYSHGKRGNALKSLLLKIWQIQNDKPYLSQMSQLFGTSWLDSAPFVHITPLPDDFDIPCLQLSSHFFSYPQTPKALLTIHNGYAFWGCRSESRYPHGKKWGPQDCSSFVAKYTNCKMLFTTFLQAKYFQEINGFQFRHLVEQDVVSQWDGKKFGRKRI
jgi:hypothetical protein